MLSVGCAAEPTSPAVPPDDITFTQRVHMMPVRDTAMPVPLYPPVTAFLDYHGGKVIPNVDVTPILYGPGTYLPEVTSTSGATMASAYHEMVTSGVFNWLSEYNPLSRAQHTSRGTARPPRRTCFNVPRPRVSRSSLGV